MVLEPVFYTVQSIHSLSVMQSSVLAFQTNIRKYKMLAPLVYCLVKSESTRNDFFLGASCLSLAFCHPRVNHELWGILEVLWTNSWKQAWREGGKKFFRCPGNCEIMRGDKSQQTQKAGEKKKKKRKEHLKAKDYSGLHFSQRQPGNRLCYPETIFSHLEITKRRQSALQLVQL